MDENCPPPTDALLSFAPREIEKDQRISPGKIDCTQPMAAKGVSCIFFIVPAVLEGAAQLASTISF